MTLKNKRILVGAVAWVLISAVIQTVWETQANEVQSIWAVWETQAAEMPNIWAVWETQAAEMPNIWAVWETQAAEMQNIWRFFSGTKIPEANTDASLFFSFLRFLFISFLIFLSFFFLIKVFHLLGWLKNKKNFKSVVENAPNKIGVYIARLDGAVVYVGRATGDGEGQNTSGLRKRLQEHYRGGQAGNDLLFTYKDKLNIKTITTGSVDKAKKLEARLIRKFNAVNNGWNKRHED